MQGNPAVTTVASSPSAPQLSAIPLQVDQQQQQQQLQLPAGAQLSTVTVDLGAATGAATGATAAAADENGGVLLCNLVRLKTFI